MTTTVGAGPEGTATGTAVFSDITASRQLAEARTRAERLEAVAERFGMGVEYGAYPHLKEPGDKEIAAVQDWTNATLVFLRPGYSRKEELLGAIAEALADGATPTQPLAGLES